MKINADNKKALTIGRQGEKNVTTVAFDVRGWIEQFGTGTFTLLHQRSGDDGAYPVKTVLEDGELLWTVDEADVFKPGIGVAQLMMMVDGKVVKSELYKTSTSQSLNETKKPPEAWKAWVDSIFEAVGTYPRINTIGNWEVFMNGAWKDTGVSAKGKVPVKGVDYFDGKDGRDGRDGTDGRDGVDGLPGRDGSDGHTPVMTGSKEGKTSTVYADGVPLINVQDGDGGGVSDVTVNGTSIVNDGVAEIPFATNAGIGVSRGNTTYGVGVNASANLYVNSASDAAITARTSNYLPIVPQHLDFAVKAALTDGKGAAYSDAERKAVRERIGLGWEVIFDHTFTEEVGITTWTQLSKNYKKFLAISFPNSNGIVSTGYAYVQLSPHESTNYGVANVVFGNASNKSAIGFSDVEHGFGVRIFNGAGLENTAQVGGITFVPLEASFFRLYVNGGNKIAVGARVLFLGSM